MSPAACPNITNQIKAPTIPEKNGRRSDNQQTHAPKTASTFVWGSIATSCAHGIVVLPWAPWAPWALEWCEPRYTLGHEMRLTRSMSA